MTKVFVLGLTEFMELKLILNFIYKTNDCLHLIFITFYVSVVYRLIYNLRVAYFSVCANITLITSLDFNLIFVYKDSADRYALY